MTKLTVEQQTKIYGKIWGLRNKMAQKLKELETIHTNQLPGVGDGVDALYTIHNVWNSDEYRELEDTIKEIRGE